MSKLTTVIIGERLEKKVYLHFIQRKQDITYHPN